jgi:hypothetical protein
MKTCCTCVCDLNPRQLTSDTPQPDASHKHIEIPLSTPPPIGSDPLHTPPSQATTPLEFGTPHSKPETPASTKPLLSGPPAYNTRSKAKPRALF